jgi:hypothetical protein
MMSVYMNHRLDRWMLVLLSIWLSLASPARLPAGTFGGQRQVNRFEMAKIVARLQAIIHREDLPRESQETLERLEREYLPQRRDLSRRVEALEADQLELEVALDPLKRGASSWPGPEAARTRIRGLISTALVVTDKGVPPASALLPLAPARTRYVHRADSTFFTLPKVSMGIDHRFQDDLNLHLHFDYATDALNPGAGGVGLSEAFLLWDDAEQGVQIKLGGFALPFQDFEIDGPFRTPTRTITPSALGTFLEAQRVLGAEFAVETPRFLAGTDWKMAFFTGSDLRVSPNGLQVGALSDAAGIQALGGSNTFDSSGGAYLEFGSSEKPGRRFRARVGWLDGGGDASAFPPATPSAEVQGLIFGSSLRYGKLRKISQVALLSSRSRSGAGGEADHDVAYQLWAWDFDDRDSISFRYDLWNNEANTTPGTGTKGHAVTYALARKFSANSRLQFEYLVPRESGEGVSRLLDYWDEQAQLRYSVWF